MAQWSGFIGARHHLTAGADWRWVEGDSREDVMDATTGTTVTLRRVSGGRQRSLGVFIQDILTPTDRLVLTLGARVDRWRNDDAHNLETVVASGRPAAGHAPTLPAKQDTVGSPRAALRYHITDRVSAWTGVNWGFRAPTLNELYRQFRVGTVLTLANAALGPERLVGGEAGVSARPAPNMTVRAAWFDNRVKRPISNVTQSVAGAAVTQQRQNLGRTRIRGIQADLEYALPPFWRVSAGYVYNDATVRAFERNPALVGRRLPQVPAHRGSLQIAYSRPRLVNLALGVQFVGRQFDDDENVRTVPGQDAPGLPGYVMTDLTLSRSITGTLDVFVGIQNLFQQEYIVGTLPTTIGAPRLAHGGVRVRLAGRD
jgi:outer membrane receptor protein involved in Fe transport